MSVSSFGHHHSFVVCFISSPLTVFLKWPTVLACSGGSFFIYRVPVAPPRSFSFSTPYSLFERKQRRVQALCFNSAAHTSSLSLWADAFSDFREPPFSRLPTTVCFFTPLVFFRHLSIIQPGISVVCYPCNIRPDEALICLHLQHWIRNGVDISSAIKAGLPPRSAAGPAHSGFAQRSISKVRQAGTAISP